MVVGNSIHCRHCGADWGGELKGLKKARRELEDLA
jgi:hypothetical protein